ncbi:somatostatin-like receptor F_48D10.1 [Biomphalaria pfeifferi]|uniref:Somatostatin-like receptor F_48D10.1 n=1 Tax=Biomphalaria pfeifferi TaxID=112525 RepID=A0AAD8FHP2_BIOPF|nr:somatostatin-like receptor F_48D10.1 [Biomphalaria pfeifferi]
MPIISLTGVTGNVISVIIISRDGLHRCSNVLICVLAVADSMYLIGLNNVANIMLGEDITFVCRPYDWVAHLIYLSNNIFAMLESTRMIVSMLVPTLIVIVFPVSLHQDCDSVEGAVCLVIFGCILISVKIHSQQRVRHKMIRCQGWEGKHNKDADKGAESFRSNKTTKILIFVCCVYSITGAFSFLSDLVFTSELCGSRVQFLDTQGLHDARLYQQHR